MIRSMTGFGAAKGKAAGLSLSIELRSVNNRYLDIGIKLPRGFLFAESFVKNALQEKISRGKIDVFFTLDLDETEPESGSIRNWHRPTVMRWKRSAECFIFRPASRRWILHGFRMC